MVRGHVSVTLGALVLALALPAAAQAVPGALDPTFGQGGLAGGSPIAAVAIQPDGKIVVGGPLDGEAGWLVARRNPDGTPDTSFNSTGYTVLPWSSASPGGGVRSLAITPDGKIVVGGWVYESSGGDSDLALAEINPDGTLDTTFGQDGEETLAIAGANLTADAMALQISAGNVVGIVVGGTACSHSPSCQFVVARFLADGLPDPSYNTTGYVESSFRSAADDTLGGLSVNSAGDIFIAGTATDPTDQGVTHPQYVLAKLGPTGVLDASFGSNGVEYTDLGLGASLNGLTTKSDGMLVTAGASCQANDCLAVLAGFSPTTGAPDTSFGTSGETVGPAGFESASAVATAPDGTILAVGRGRNPFFHSWRFAIQRYTATGQIDPTFGTDGLSTAQDNCQSEDTAGAVAIQSDGDAVVVGDTLQGERPDGLLARFESGPGVAAAGGCGPPTLVRPPIAWIISPRSGHVYSPAEHVTTSFRCIEGAFGPAVFTCGSAYGDAASGGPFQATLDTSTPGAHTYSITTWSADGLHSTASINYRVAAAPTVSIAAPASGSTIPYRAAADVSYACADGSGGPGIDGCAGTVANGSALPTTSAGTHSFTVRARSIDGLSTSKTVSYRVLFPPNGFTVTGVKSSPTGALTFDVDVPGPGKIDALATTQQRLVIARDGFVASRAGNVAAIIRPNGDGRRVMKHHRPIVLRLSVTFTPTGGSPRTEIRGVRL
jgi:uncharacterized delta-60 repeat protein